MTTFYALRRKTDGHMLPAFGRRRGHTNAEPVAMGKKPPRLFTHKHHAAAALKWWLEGAWFQRVYDPEYGDYGDVELDSVDKPERRAEDWEVVPVDVSVVTPLA